MNSEIFSQKKHISESENLPFFDQKICFIQERSVNDVALFAKALLHKEVFFKFGPGNNNPFEGSRRTWRIRVRWRYGWLLG